MIRLLLRYLGAALLMLLGVACGSLAAPAPTPDRPSPTIAALARSPTPAGQPPARPSPSPSNPAAQPSATPDSPPAVVPPATGQAPAPEPSIYLWPADLPAGLSVAPEESRVAADGEVGPNGLGFYIVTLNAGDKKLVIGGGDLEALPLVGDERPVTAGRRAGKLIAKDQQREILLDVSRGKLFLYSQGLSEEELLRAAESLQAIDVRALRELVKAQ